jgi:RNA polymerase sigma factor (sigma-70 family)
VSSSEQERQLLTGLAGNKKEAVEQLYRDHYPVIQSFILNNAGSVDDARDVFQEALVVLFKKSKDPGFSLQCQIRTYLYSICRRLWLKRLQQMSKLAYPADSLEDIVPVEEDLQDHEKKNTEFQIMEMAMSKIGEPCKSLLDAYYFQKKSMLDIATDFGYTNADNAKTQKYKCLMRLKKLFFAQYKN